MSDWIFDNVQELRTKRLFYTQRYYLHTDYLTNNFEVPELMYTADQDEERSNLLKIVCIYRRFIYNKNSPSHKLSFNHNIINHIYNIS